MRDRSLPWVLRNAASAVRQFLTDEAKLLAVDINERSLSARLAMHLQQHFPKLDVDCEYNRLGDAIKRLPKPEDSRTSNLEGRTIFPDIIVHLRGTKSNILVLELKKTRQSSQR